VIACYTLAISLTIYYKNRGGKRLFLKNFKIGQKLFWGFGIVTLLMLVVLGYTYINFTKESRAIDLNIESYSLIRETDQMMITLNSMEASSRGFALTGKDEFLEPFTLGKAEYVKQFNTLRELMNSNEKNQERLKVVQRDYEEWIKYQSEQIIEKRREVNAGIYTMDELVAEAQKGIAKEYMESIRSVLNEINTEEQSLLEIRKNDLEHMEALTLIVILLGGSVSAVLAFFIALLVIRMVVKPVQTVTNTFKEISEGDVDLEVRLKINSNDELGAMSKYFNRFMEKLKELITENLNQSWLKVGQAELSEKLRKESDITSLSSNIITFVSKYVNAHVGALYIRSGDDIYKMAASYAYKNKKNLSDEVKIGEGIIGQSALEKHSYIVSNIPEDYISIATGIGESAPKSILISPCVRNGEAECIVELASLHEFTKEQLHFVELVSESIAISIGSVKAQQKMKELLSKTLQQSEELQSQQEELRQSNEELEQQTKALMESEEQLQYQQEELRVINEELEERTRSLEIQATDILAKNEELRQAQVEVENKAKALESANRYKSEFLANMSHELRTPLNSILVLSQMLTEAKDGYRLSDKQQQYAATIHSSGEDLLRLINDILDLSKVEAGKLDINIENMELRGIASYASRTFNAIAEKKGLTFNIEVDNDVPDFIESDSQRVLQIVNNLLSNAFKFTQSGTVSLLIKQVKDVEFLERFNGCDRLIGISIKDTGIGIPLNKQGVIFEAFKQSDGTTSRKYGGTGLGLSISKELSRLLGGEIKLESAEGEGSTFTLILPEKFKEDKPFSVNQSITYEISTITNGYTEENSINEKNIIADIITLKDKAGLMGKSNLILIIEDDENFSSLLVEIAKEKGYDCLIAEGGVQGLHLAVESKPDAILLDIGLPDISGWKVAERLKNMNETKNIPIHIISGREQDESGNKFRGILGYLQKPVSIQSIDDTFKRIEATLLKQFKKLLIVGHHTHSDMEEILRDKEIQVLKAESGAQAINLLRQENFDCMILEYNLEDMFGLDLLEILKDKNLNDLPIIIYTEKVLSRQEEENLQKYTESIIIKGSCSRERLASEASLFLHNIDSKREKKSLKAIRNDIEKEDSFKDKKVLIVDDDMRNVFALTSILEEKGLQVIVGRNGKEAISKLKEDNVIDIVLMDIMMPEMDGYMAMREIRKEERFSKLPIIAITAKAMKEDRLHCIEAGADDYLTKPIDIERLISLLRVWLYK
jgi:signal transduction histidine kinase/DNA-binding response OmpR family regulator/CHASE3 domain sensor protein